MTFLRSHAKVNSDKVLEEGAIFVSLTFPNDLWIEDAADFWRRARESFKRRLDRRDQKAEKRTLGSWRLELADERSPYDLHPHYHCILISGLAKRPIQEVRAWIAQQWSESCGRLSDDHLKAGTSVEEIETRLDWLKGSKYVGKRETLQVPIPVTGRACGWWGWSRIEESFIDPEPKKLSREEAIELREDLVRGSTYELPKELYSMKSFVSYEEVGRMLEWTNYPQTE